MALSITPQRRGRYEDTPPEDTFDDDDAGRSSKRRRLSENDEDRDEDSEVGSPERPLLPDTYRRSPKNKQRARDSRGGHGKQEHRPGSIVRVSLKNFVTYTDAEFHPGPNLNMVIGPNGTGKSTLVCAICIGLGWSTANLGRAKDVAEFVKHGCRQAEIEIELKADPERHVSNPIIHQRIDREGGGKSGKAKSDWSLNGKKSSAKEVQALARSFHIQVDNLCQFLPQDRVVEFAALNSVELLVQTQRAAAPDHVSDWHEQLKAMGKDRKAKQSESENLEEQIKSMEDRQRAQEGDVQRLRERDALQEQLRLLQRMKPFAQYFHLQRRHAAMREQRREAVKELRHLERRMAPNLAAVNAKKAYRDQIENVVGSRSRLLGRSERNADEQQQKVDAKIAAIKDLEGQIETENTGGRKANETIQKHQRSVREIEIALKNPPASFNAEEMNRQIREVKVQIRRIENEQSEIQSSGSNLKEQARQRQVVIREQESRKGHLQSQVGRQESKLERASADAARAWKWIQENRVMFVGEVYGPPMITCSVKEARHANAVESIIGPSELLAFTVTSQEDFRTLEANLYRGQLKLSSINIRTSVERLEHFRPPCSQEELRRYGFQNWLLDLIEGPEPVVAMLCDNRNVHQTAFSERDISNDQHTAVVNSSISSYVAGTSIGTVTRRREYGAQGISTRMSSTKAAQLLTDAPVDTQEQQEISRRIAEARGEIGQITEELTGLHTRHVRLNQEKRRLDDERETIEKDKKEKQKAQTEYQGLNTKLENLKARLNDAKAQKAGQRERIAGKRNEIDEMTLLKAQLSLDCARAVDALRGLHVQLYEAEIMLIEADSDLEQLQARHADEQNQIAQKEQEVQETQAAEGQAREEGKAVQAECLEVQGTFTPQEQAYYNEHEGRWGNVNIENEIETVQASLDALHGGNDNVIQEFEQRARKIEQRRNQLDGLRSALETIETNITNIKRQWEPVLDELVREISDAFAENFSRIQCAGEVGIHKDEDFEQWAIEIKVKFRENEPLSKLDNHRQSGGERAVSTIFYLMALQSLAKAPFRVVDEINQGMDPRNERMVHSRMVEIACAEHTSQYFLITPKLLNNLQYDRNMKVHCIASGEYMPEDHRRLDFGILAAKALAVKAGAI